MIVYVATKEYRDSRLCCFPLGVFVKEEAAHSICKQDYESKAWDGAYYFVTPMEIQGLAELEKRVQALEAKLERMDGDGK